MIQKVDQPKLLLVGQIDFAKDAWEEVESSFEVMHYTSGSRDDFINKCQEGAFDGIVALARSNQYNDLTGNIDEELVPYLPQSLNAVCNIGCGVNTINASACRARDIIVTNTPSVGRDAVADATIFLILGALRRAVGALSRVRSGRWQEDTDVGLDTSGRVLGLYGFGSIASGVATRAKAFGMKVQYYSRSSEQDGYQMPTEHAEAGYKNVSFDELLTTSDVISIHAPLSPETHHVFGKAQFARMKEGVVIVNTARGPLVDQDALIEAVQSGHVWSVGMDVFAEEPSVPEFIRRDERFFITPHVATKTTGTRKEMESVMITNLIAVMTGSPVPNVVKA